MKSLQKEFDDLNLAADKVLVKQFEPDGKIICLIRIKIIRENYFLHFDHQI